MKKLHLTDLIMGLMVISAFLVLLPGRLWFWPTLTNVSDAVIGQAPIVYVERKIFFSFKGSYTVDVRHLKNNRVACGKPGGHNYKAGLTEPFSTDLVDWAGGDRDCGKLQAGSYVMETCWTIEHPFWGLLPPKKVCITSNVFEIKEDEK